MRYLVSSYSYQDLCKNLIGKNVNFKSNCEFFPNFDISGKVLSISIASNNEYLIKIVTKNHKYYDIGSNMKELSFLII